MLSKIDTPMIAFRDSEYKKLAENQKEAQRVAAQVPFKPLIPDLINLVFAFCPTEVICELDRPIRYIDLLVAKGESAVLNECKLLSNAQKYTWGLSRDHYELQQYPRHNAHQRSVYEVPLWAQIEYRNFPKLTPKLYDAIRSFCPDPKEPLEADKHLFELHQFFTNPIRMDGDFFTRTPKHFKGKARDLQEQLIRKGYEIYGDVGYEITDEEEPTPEFLAFLNHMGYTMDDWN